MPLCRAQQKPQYSQYMMNSYLLNPALTGVENYLDLKASYRNQWSGLQGAPTSFYLSAHGPIGKQDRSASLVSLPARGKSTIINNLRLRTENDFKFLKPHQGLGAVVLADKTGPESRLSGSLTYAYHLPVHQNKMKLSLGASAGFTQYKLDLSQLDFGPHADPVVDQYRQDRWLPELGAGAVLYGRRFYVGASAAQLLQDALQLGPQPLESASRFRSHYFLTGGYEYRLSREVSVMPSLLVKYVQPSPVSVDVNLKVSYLRKMWGGLSYRHQNAVAAMGGLSLNSLLNLGYAYEMATSSLQSYNSGSHEIMVGLNLYNTYQSRLPF